MSFTAAASTHLSILSSSPVPRVVATTQQQAPRRPRPPAPTSLLQFQYRRTFSSPTSLKCSALVQDKASLSSPSPSSSATTATATPSTSSSPFTDSDEDESYFGPSSTTTTTNHQTKQQKKGGRVVVESEEELKSTWEQRGWVALTSSLLLGTLWQGTTHIPHGDLVEGFKCSAALYMAWSLSDVGSGVYHWGVDNYGDADTPLFGSQIAAFQGHHKRPWTITEREFCNNVYKVFKPASVPSALLLAASPFTPAWFSIWASSFMFLVCMAQQFHAWSHMKKSQLPGVVHQAQQMGILVNRKDHGAHHKPPFNNNYCIVSGQWNPILDKSGIWMAAEKYILDTYGVEPRSWSEPDAAWTEEERMTSSSSSV